MHEVVSRFGVLFGPLSRLNPPPPLPRPLYPYPCLYPTFNSIFTSILMTIILYPPSTSLGRNREYGEMIILAWASGESDTVSLRPQARVSHQARRHGLFLKQRVEEDGEVPLG